METVSIQLPETVFTALHKEPNEFVQEMRIAAAVKWYELGEISQEKAAEIAGLTRSEFIDALARYKVSSIQYTAEELAKEGANDSTVIKPQTQLSLEQIAALPVAERHKLLADSIASTAEDFLNEPELTEFSVLDGEDWATGND
nr:UPF0175 family protein [Chroococcidiopsis sp. CCMEE 29]